MIIIFRGFEFIWNHLRPDDVKCYWKKLLIQYASLITWSVEKEDEMIIIN